MNQIEPYVNRQQYGSMVLGWPKDRGIETKNGLEGYFDEILENYYLCQYYDILHRSHPHLFFEENAQLKTRIPELISKIFVPVFNTHSDEIGTVHVTGELPREIAHHNPFYWQHFVGLQEDMKSAIRDTKSQKVRDFCKSGLEFPHDPDIDITFRDVNVRLVSNWFKQAHGVDRTYEDNEEENYVLFLDDEYEVSVHVAPLKTRPKVILMAVNITDKNSGDRVFHLDIGSFPEDVGDAVIDKRVVSSTRKQDVCQGILTGAHNRLYFTLSQKAKENMFQQDFIHKKDPVSLFELVTRGMRIAVSHPVEDNIDFNRFMPQVASRSIFATREIFRNAAYKNEKVPEVIQFFTIKELILCFRYDPYQTVQMLRDSGISSLIPGLSKLTPFDFDAILRSNSFSIEMIDRIPIPDHMRDEVYIQRQRKLYRKETMKGKQDYVDGLQRFVNALRELNLMELDIHDSWGSFFELFCESEKASTHVNGGEISDHLVTLIEIAGYAPKQLKREIENYFQLFNKKKLTTEEKITRSKLKTKLYSISGLFNVMKQHSNGLTPRELRSLYKNLKSKGENGFRKLEFSGAFAHLKQLGVIFRYEMDRIAEFGGIVPVDIYFPLPEDADIHSFTNQIERLNEEELDEIAFLYEMLMKFDDPVHTTTSKQIQSLMKSLAGLDITLESLESMEPQDLDEFIKTDFIKPVLKNKILLLRESLRYFYAWRYLQERGIPDCYKLTFLSAESKEILKEYLKVAKSLEQVFVENQMIQRLNNPN